MLENTPVGEEKDLLVRCFARTAHVFPSSLRLKLALAESPDCL
jgi:hypothetical protein